MAPPKAQNFKACLGTLKTIPKPTAGIAENMALKR
jgi:hypothetical protein